ncbi:hypothetical protein Kpol_1059p14 [Vanderwaltozyma polyspora DSM 70294]|uniref:Manganese transporter SMF1 n=1 Tax=Vanderwaltozyma polyspora (strain ATCC 22028 / DSM 70294 / BCRC 21397 / CBS 2163 / NBRC 10782 / NRRL Y-8283 / UCD 57-17) TaxID=436907 RepID=A7TN18_VANPO|nr:uncharacterized protein Kpol_1059p14 [Vanderwaltozyma polyspora DSM 70294]EDO16324.1 hypothetical protein Kpol_1059p14 [Vanderwaltozyma polyspora DSM 70294]
MSYESEIVKNAWKPIEIEIFESDKELNPRVGCSNDILSQIIEVVSSNGIKPSNSNDDEKDDSKGKKIVNSFSWGNIKTILKKYAKFIGPGIMISVAYIDPGNYSTAVDAGASNQFSLLCIVLVSNIIAIFLQCLCIKLGSVTGLDLSRACREFLPRWLNLILYFFAECCIIATDVAEVIGTAIALNILIKVPLPAGVAISVVDVFIIMIFYRPGSSSMNVVRYFEYGVGMLVIAVFICFCIELSYIPDTTSAGQVFRGFVPSAQMFKNNGIYTAISILGATVMPHSMFLGSGLVQPRLLEYDLDNNNYSMTDSALEGKKSKEQIMEERYFDYRPTLDAIKYCMKYSIIELVLTLLSFALFINCAILIVAGATLYGSPEATDADLYTIHDLLSRNLSSGAGTIFMLALLLSGQSAGIICTMAGQIVSEGHIKWKLVPWQRRLVTRCISIIPCLVISICIGREALSLALNSSQVVLSILLPFLTAPLIYFTSKKSIMKTEVLLKDTDEVSEDENSVDGDLQVENGQRTKTVYMANNWFTTIIGILIWIFLSILNIYGIVQLGITGQP